MDQIGNHNLMKIGLIVEDIEKTAKRYCQLFGLEMPEIYAPDANETPVHMESSYTWYRGAYRPARTKFAVLRMGAVELELLEPYDEPSPWNEFKQKHGNGVHFITYTIDGFNEHIELLESQGMPVTHKGEYGSGRYCYFDSEEALGVTLGLQELGPNQDESGRLP